MITLCLNIFADLVSLRSISISFHNIGNITDGKLSKFLFKTRSNLYDFVLLGSAKGRKEGRGKVIVKVSMLLVWFHSLLYLVYLPTVFSISSNYIQYLSKLYLASLPTSNCIQCLSKLYSVSLPIVFSISKNCIQFSISPNCIQYLFQLYSVFLLIVFSISPNCIQYLCQL